jgi:hypothetical protein
MAFYDEHPILTAILLGGGTYAAYRWLASTDAPTESAPVIRTDAAGRKVVFRPAHSLVNGGLPEAADGTQPYELEHGDVNWAYVKSKGEIIGQVYFMDAGAWIATGDDPDIESPPFETKQEALDWLRDYYAD